MGCSFPSLQALSLQELLSHMCPPPAIIFTAGWGGPRCYFSGIERRLPDTKVNLVKKQDFLQEVWSSAEVTFAVAPSCLVLLLS